MTTHLVDTLMPGKKHATLPVLRLFNGPRVTSGPRQLAIPEGGQRILAFIALHDGHRVDRRQLAGALWPLGSDQRASGNLRSALWRISRAEPTLVRSEKTFVTLRQDLVIDAHLVAAWAQRLLSGHHQPADLNVLPLGLDGFDLLPGWYEDWVLAERERTQQRLIHAVEALSRALRAAGRHAEAVDAALTAVTADPLRESAQRMLIEAHLSEGNRAQARQAYLRYRDLLRRELGVEPQPALDDLFQGVDLSRNQWCRSACRSSLKHGRVSMIDVAEHRDQEVTCTSTWTPSPPHSM